ncbi:hypothetical protein CS063_14300 [Sporanaerobium hydrogeniformans]|uniref:Uncharacterized protein n=1 Tax=Sporanaerobium hydrogeniformans TaxID=3072179 RepID=A0AC61DAJ6_9FIRM|nr:FtsX-like permease family protein [Sporanaerobium hydrogeniformans]PHV69761.1 hypothetical protein CS063_14300 [Sporanaerobium hydrogeniformans]
MNKAVLLPKLSINGIKQNSTVYVPYMLITSFSVFVFFIFSAICDNEILYDLPYAGYVIILMEVGRVLLGIILAPILFSTHEFLVKQRKNELGLYNVLGLDQKYISMIMCLESIFIYIATTAFGVLVATIFSKLIYLLLLNISGLPVDTEFVGSLRSYEATIIYFGVISLVNLGVSLWQIFISKPIELLKSSKKGEREVKFLGFKAIIGFLILALGYYIALITELDSMIFIHFFLAVMLVIWGTRSIFKTGTIAILRWMKSRPSIYYKKKNFVTISGMLYRMKRNAQGLANICIFSTMIIITLICTLTVLTGEDGAVRFNYPMDAEYRFSVSDFNTREKQESFKGKVEEIAKLKAVKVTDYKEFTFQKIKAYKKDNAFLNVASYEENREDVFDIRFMSLADYNRIEHEQQTLEKNEVLIFSKGKDFVHDEVILEGKSFKVKKELKVFTIEAKEERNMVDETYYIILKEQETIDALAAKFSTSSSTLSQKDELYNIHFNIEGTKENKDLLIQDINTYIDTTYGHRSSGYIEQWRQETRSMNGGFIFLGIFFGIVFSVCLVQMMYYKQITEGFEDKKSFEILQQVGMSDEEVKATIKRQILIVFFLPLIFAIIHIIFGLQVVKNLLGVLNLYNDILIYTCSGVVIIVFTMLYISSYLFTAKAYYKIVKRMN